MIEKENKDNLEILMEKNIEISQEILDLAKRFKKYIFWQKIWTILKLVLILTPIILAVIYLPPFLKDLVRDFHSLISSTNSLSGF